MRVYLGIVLCLMFFPFLAHSAENNGTLRVFVFKGSKVLEKGTVYLERVGPEGAVSLSKKIEAGEVLFTAPSGTYEIWFNRRKAKSRTEVSIGSTGETQVVYDVKDEGGLSKPKSLFKEPSLATADLGETTVVRGAVFSRESKGPVSSALVVVKGTSFQAKTDENGIFSISIPKERSIDIAVIHPQFSTQQIKGLSEANWDSQSSISLAPSMGELSEFVVLAPQGKGSLEALLKERRNAETVSDFIGAEQIAKTGDSNAGSALKRVTGLSLINGRFVYVRGLGERYSSTVLNKATLPSPDPSRKVVPLDMFPTSIIESISIQKSFSVDRSAEFSAGVVEIRTKSIPDKFQAGLSLSTSFASTAVLKGEQDGLFHTGGGQSDLSGFDDGSRELPGAIQEVRETGKRIEPGNIFVPEIGFPEDELQDFGRSFSNNYDTRQGQVDPGFGLSFNLGDRATFGVQKVGGFVKANYSVSRDHDILEQTQYELASEEIGLEKTIFDRSTLTEERVNLGGLTSAGVEFLKSQKLSVTGVLSRSTSNTTQFLDRDASLTDDTIFKIYRLGWQERELGSLQLKGEHSFRENFKGPKLEWLLSRSRALRLEPDFRQYQYSLVAGVPTFSSARSNSNQRMFSELDDLAENAQVKFSFAVDLTDRLTWSPFFGAALSIKDRVSEVQRFRFADQGFAGRETPNTAPLSEILASDNIVPGGFELIDSTEDTDNYRATAENRAYFFSNSLKYKFTEDRFLNVYGGVRVEDHEQGVSLFSIFEQDESIDELNTIELATEDSFPAAGLNFQINKKASLRFGYSETVSRPDFKELAPANYFNYEENVIERGNSALQPAYVDNYDLRYDYFLSADEFFSVGGFFKDIENPIEAFRIPSTDNKRSFTNVAAAEVQGIEIEGRIGLKRASNVLRSFYLSANYAIIDSLVDLEGSEGSETSSERPLQGQSPYLLNIGLEYQKKNWGLDSSLVYNVAGRRISAVGDSGAPDTYEEPFHQLDWTLRKKISKSATLGLKIRNILDSSLRRVQGGLPTRDIRDGRTYSLSLTANI